MSKDQNMTTQNILIESLSGGNLNVLNELFVINVIDHDPLLGQQPGVEGLKESYSKLRQAFPDMRMSLELVVTDERNVCYAYVMTGTHKGAYQGIPAANKSFTIRGVKIARFENGLIVEQWGSLDEYGIIRALQERATVPSKVPSISLAL